MTLAFGWSDLAYLTLSVFLVLAGLSLAYGFFRLGATLGRASSLLGGVERELLPVVTKLGDTIDRVNEQLDKVDQVTDSAVDAVAGMDAAVRAIGGTVMRPAHRLAGLAAGVRRAASTLRDRGGLREALRTGREEAASRERGRAEGLGLGGAG